jgi:hypothetical protein
MPQNEHIELHRKRFGRRLDHEERTRKKQAREVKKRSAFAQKALGLKGKMFAKKRHAEKAQMKKTIAMHEERDNKHKAVDGAPQNAVPAYLLEREQVRAADVGQEAPSRVAEHMRCPERRLPRLPAQVDRAKVLSNTIKQKRKEKAGKWEVPLPQVRFVARLQRGCAQLRSRRAWQHSSCPCELQQAPAADSRGRVAGSCEVASWAGACSRQQRSSRVPAQRCCGRGAAVLRHSRRRLLSCTV